MPSLKSIRKRISSVKSTKKITSAMKLVAAARLRRAQEGIWAVRPYAVRLQEVISELAGRADVDTVPPEELEAPLEPLAEETPEEQRRRYPIIKAAKLLRFRPVEKRVAILLLTSDRGLCGAFNSSIVRGARQLIRQLLGEGKTVKIMTVGRKGRDQLRRDFGKLIVESMEDVGKRRLAFTDAQRVTDRIVAMYGAGEFDVCTVIYNRFKSAITQIVTRQQIIPFPVEADGGNAATESGAIYEFEPDEEEILAALLPRNLAVQVYRALLENAASEQGARMSAMDSATRNAGDMIKRLTLNYNRTRQAMITKELIEIISGAEAV
jgi:F-type H+-transporting ATPase subunit gamma